MMGGVADGWDVFSRAMDAMWSPVIVCFNIISTERVKLRFDILE